MAAYEKEQVFPEMESQTEFYCGFENSIQVLQDQKTIFGIKFDDICLKHSVLVREKLSKEPLDARMTEFGQHRATIDTLLLMERFNCLFAGDTSGDVAQYRLGR